MKLPVVHALRVDEAKIVEQMNEHDCIVLTEDLQADGMKAGDVGTVVHVHKGGEAYEVEFITLTGETIALATIRATQARPILRSDMVHVRELLTAKS